MTATSRNYDGLGHAAVMMREVDCDASVILHLVTATIDAHGGQRPARAAVNGLEIEVVLCAAVITRRGPGAPGYGRLRVCCIHSAKGRAIRPVLICRVIRIGLNFWWTTHFNRTRSDELLSAVWMRPDFAHREDVQLAENVSVQPTTVGE